MKTNTHFWLLRPSWSYSKAVYKSVWRIPLLSVQWTDCSWWTDELSETCRVSWQNTFVKLVHLAGFITKKFVTIRGHMNVKNPSRTDSCIKVWNFSKVSGTVSFSETFLNFHTLTRLSIPEHFIEFCRRESFKSYCKIIFINYILSGMNNGFGQLWGWKGPASSVMEWLSVGVVKALSLSLFFSLSRHAFSRTNKNYHPFWNRNISVSEKLSGHYR